MEVRQGSVFQTEKSVTVLEPTRRRITFFKNTCIYEVGIYTNGVEREVKICGHESALSKLPVEGNGSDTGNGAHTPKRESKETGRCGGPPSPDGESSISLSDKQIDEDKACTPNSECTTFLGEHVCECFGILGVVRFVEGPYLVVVTDAVVCGKLLSEHDLYTIRGKTLVPLYHPCSNRYTENYYRSMFNQFDISNNFYFSYTYNLANSLQTNQTYARCNRDDDTWLPFDAGVVTQKFRYNFSHVRNLGDSFGREAECLCLRVIHGYLGQATICLSGRSLVLHLIARRSRFYAGTRYRKRGITADGHVANDVETEQILEDATCTISVFSFVQVRGSTPIFWAQDATQTIMKKPPLTYPQYDPTFSSTRLHIAELLSLYGSPLIMLNLLSDDPDTEEGQLSRRYKEVIEAINEEMSPAVHMQYINRNLRSAFERRRVRKMVTEIIDHVSKELGYFHMRDQGILNIQTGVLRASCLDCLDRTSVIAMHLGLLIFQKQLATIGVYVSNNDAPNDLHWPNLPCHTSSDNEESGLDHAFDPVRELFKNMFQQLGDDLALQYAGSKTLRKYEGTGGAFSVSLQLLTTIKRRYYSHFADSDRQTLSNIFLGVLRPDRHPPPWIMDVDAYIHHEHFKCDYNILDWWVVPLMCYLKRIRKLDACVSRPWFELFDEQGEYRLWVLMAKLLARHSVSPQSDQNIQSSVMGVYDPNMWPIEYQTARSTAFIAAPHNTDLISHFDPGYLCNQLTNSCMVDYTDFKRCHSGKAVHITRSDEDDGTSTSPMLSGRCERFVTLPSWAFVGDTSVRYSDRGLFRLKQPDVDVISRSLQPWRIAAHGGELFSDVSKIQCREHDRIFYKKFVGVLKAV
ncbi:putative Sac domain-containing inositol phosphatase 3 [Babesia divergens]|uniref:Sac domain-containing inositol phosphatase 3 n=1 Tax=Babesia divergens TaxID=32595 RepID=A0AAD9GDF4_BABDI|nr:putative Sac domain-containing inositol phosphatase 3 [Babesia divergens]